MIGLDISAKLENTHPLTDLIDGISKAMSMNELRLLAAKIDQGIQQLSALGISDAQTIVNRMVGYLPDLKMIWDSTSDQQLIALTDEYPGFYRYALIMEEAFEDERKKSLAPV